MTSEHRKANHLTRMQKGLCLPGVALQTATHHQTFPLPFFPSLLLLFYNASARIQAPVHYASPRAGHSASGPQLWIDSSDASRVVSLPLWAKPVERGVFPTRLTERAGRRPPAMSAPGAAVQKSYKHERASCVAVTQRSGDAVPRDSQEGSAGIADRLTQIVIFRRECGVPGRRHLQ